VVIFCFAAYDAPFNSLAFLYGFVASLAVYAAAVVVCLVEGDFVL
jgi:hypothetical protein